MTLTVVRSMEEIKARIRAYQQDPFEDLFGANRMDLIGALPFEEAEEWRQSDVTSEEWAAQEPVETQAIEYLTFAIGKAEGHRGLSAGRSIDHYRAWLWLLLDDERYAAWEAVDYQNYGAPMLKKAAEILGAPWPTPEQNPELNRMAEGLPCEPDCDAGCGS